MTELTGTLSLDVTDELSIMQKGKIKIKTKTEYGKQEDSKE